MIDICNIFRPIDKKTGNFLLFSQYVSDLSISTINNNNYRVRPSKFVCLNLDESVIESAKDITGLEEYNEALPGYFQNYFENGISVAKSNGISIDKHNFSTAFWERLINLVGKESYTVNLQDYVTFVGDIDIESWKDGFADIILNIPSGSKKDFVYLNDYVKSDLGEFKEMCGIYDYSSPNNYISGWMPDEATIPINGTVEGTQYIGLGNSSATVSQHIDNGNYYPIFYNIFTSEKDQEANDFHFNTIVILYDILTELDTVIASQIPMGVYFTGDVNEDGELNNPVTIYTSVDDAYGAGSAWSLRIGTRFSPTPQGYLKVEEVAIESGALYDSISALMSADAEVIKNLNDFADKSIYNSQTIKNLYSLFKNSMTNIPYIKVIGGEQYWFVNGKNLGKVDPAKITWDDE